MTTRATTFAFERAALAGPAASLILSTLLLLRRP